MCTWSSPPNDWPLSSTTPKNVISHANAWTPLSHQLWVGKEVPRLYSLCSRTLEEKHASARPTVLSVGETHPGDLLHHAADAVTSTLRCSSDSQSPRRRSGSSVERSDHSSATSLHVGAPQHWTLVISSPCPRASEQLHLFAGMSSTPKSLSLYLP